MTAVGNAKKCKKLRYLAINCHSIYAKKVCDYSKCDRCARKLETMNNLDEHPYWSKGNKAKKMLHLYFQSKDMDTHMNRRKYKNIIKMSNNPRKQMMKQFLNVSKIFAVNTLTFFGVDHVSLLYGVISNLHDTEKVLEEIEYYNIQNAVTKFGNATMRKEVIAKEIIRECADFWLVGCRDYSNTTIEEIMEYVDHVFALA